jgi:hypothetical protein
MIAKYSIIAAMILAAGVKGAGAQTAAADEKVTVASLLGKRYTIVGVISTASGAPGLFLQKESSLFACFISETPKSPSVATRYCKPVE